MGECIYSKRIKKSKIITYICHILATFLSHFSNKYATYLLPKWFILYVGRNPQTAKSILRGANASLFLFRVYRGEVIAVWIM